jgi:Lhr-like helicase
MDAITLALVEYYKRDLESAIHRLELEERRAMKLAQEVKLLTRQYHALEDFAQEQEQRADALAQVINGFIENTTNEVRRDLMDEFNAVARELDIDLDVWDQDLESDEVLMEDITGLDEFFDV